MCIWTKNDNKTHPVPPNRNRCYSLTKLCFEGFLLLLLMYRVHSVALPDSPGRLPHQIP